MNFRTFSNQKRNELMLICNLFICLLLLFLQDSKIIEMPERVGMGLNASISSGMNELKKKFASTINSITSLRNLQIEYDLLSQQLEQNQVNFQNIKSLEQENELLRQQLAYSEQLEHRHVSAQIIGKDPGIYFSDLILNKGNKHGVTIGMPVVAFQDSKQGLVGRVVELSWNSSIIRPVLSVNSYVAGRLHALRYEGLIRGLGSESNLLIMQFLDRKAKEQISIGDEVVSSGLESIYPENILIGHVSSISAIDYSTSLEVEIVPFIEFTRLENVFLLFIQELFP